MPLCSFNRKLIRNLLELFAEMDRQTGEFRRETGLHCPDGCGRCCEAKPPEVTVIEMLPAAEEVFFRGEARQWLDRIASAGETARCVFFLPDSSIPGNGCCQFYEVRPSVCRLFGFAAMKNREGRWELQTCRRQKEEMPHLIEKGREAILKGAVPPNFDSFYLRMATLEPGLIRSRVPINRALRLALEKYGLLLQLIQ